MLPAALGSVTAKTCWPNWVRVIGYCFGVHALNTNQATTVVSVRG
jgi:hypothetical protein